MELLSCVWFKFETKQNNGTIKSYLLGKDVFSFFFFLPSFLENYNSLTVIYFGIHWFELGNLLNIEGKTKKINFYLKVSKFPAEI